MEASATMLEKFNDFLLSVAIEVKLRSLFANS